MSAQALFCICCVWEPSKVSKGLEHDGRCDYGGTQHYKPENFKFGESNFKCLIYNGDN